MKRQSVPLILLYYLINLFNRINIPFSSSPIKNPVNVSFCQEDSSITPDSSFHRDLVLDEEPKTTIEPKNLMQVIYL